MNFTCRLAGGLVRRSVSRRRRVGGQPRGLNGVSILLLLLTAAGPATLPTDPALLAKLAAVDAKVAQLHDVTADFTQQKFTPLLKKPLTSTGRVIGKGDRTLWLTEKPEPTSMAVDAGGIRLFYPSQNVVEIYPVQGQLASLASSPLPRLSVLEKFFRFESMPGGDDTTLKVKLTPTDDTIRDHVDEVDVVLDTSTGIIRSATNIDADGDRTVLTFANVRTDTGLDDAALDLKLPAGTRTVKPLEGLGDSPPAAGKQP